jgi:hypothetical protein
MCIISQCQVIGQVASGSAGEVHFMIFPRSQNFKSEVAVLCSRSTPYGIFYSRCGRVFPLWLRVIGFGLSFEKAVVKENELLYCNSSRGGLTWTFEMQWFICSLTLNPVLVQLCIYYYNFYCCILYLFHGEHKIFVAWLFQDQHCFQGLVKLIAILDNAVVVCGL